MTALRTGDVTAGVHVAAGGSGVAAATVKTNDYFAAVNLAIQTPGLGRDQSIAVSLLWRLVTGAPDRQQPRMRREVRLAAVRLHFVGKPIPDSDRLRDEARG